MGHWSPHDRGTCSPMVRASAGNRHDLINVLQKLFPLPSGKECMAGNITSELVHALETLAEVNSDPHMHGLISSTPLRNQH